MPIGSAPQQATLSAPSSTDSGAGEARIQRSQPARPVNRQRQRARRALQTQDGGVAAAGADHVFVPFMWS